MYWIHCIISIWLNITFLCSDASRAPFLILILNFYGPFFPNISQEWKSHLLSNFLLSFTFLSNIWFLNVIPFLLLFATINSSPNCFLLFIHRNLYFCLLRKGQPRCFIFTFFLSHKLYLEILTMIIKNSNQGHYKFIKFFYIKRNIRKKRIKYNSSLCNLLVREKRFWGIKLKKKKLEIQNPLAYYYLHHVMPSNLTKFYYSNRKA